MAYQIVPYTFSVAVVRVPDGLRPLDNLNGAADAAGALSVLDLIAKAAASQGKEQRLPEETSLTSLGVTAIYRGTHVSAIEVSNGRRGVRADIDRTRDGQRAVVDVQEHDWTLTPTRCVFFAPPGAKKGIALIERAGHVGATTVMQNIIAAALKARHADLRFRLAPAMSPEYVAKWANESQVKGIVLQHTNIKTGEAARSVHGVPVTTVFSVKPPRKRGWPWTKFIGDQLDGSAQKAILTEVIPQMPLSATAADVDATASKMINDGWSVALEVERDGRKRTVQVDAQATLTLSFPASVNNTAGRPEHDDFVRACQATIKELGSANLSVGDAGLCTWPTDKWVDTTPWKAVWGVPESQSPGDST